MLGYCAEVSASRQLGQLTRVIFDNSCTRGPRCGVVSVVDLDGQVEMIRKGGIYQCLGA
jgi:hypothetical protein